MTRNPTDCSAGAGKGREVDVIELKARISQLEKELSESEARANALINLGTEAGEGIVMLQDVDGKEAIQTFVNNQWCRIIGYKEEELVGTSLIELESPKDQEISLKRHRLKMTGVAMPGLYEMDVIRKDGTTIPVEITGAYTTYQGKRANVVYIRDVSDRKQVEGKLKIEGNRLSKLIEYAPIAIIELDFSSCMPMINNLKANGINDFFQYFVENPEVLYNFLSNPRQISINRAGLETYVSDIIKFPEILKNVSERKLDSTEISEEDKECFKGVAHLYSQLVEGSKAPFWEFPRPTHDNKYRNIRSYLYSMPGHEYDLSWVMVIEIDITDRIEVENSLKEYQQHLEDMVRQRTLDLNASFEREHELSQKLALKVKQQVEFIRRLVHDLKTPLFPVLSVSEMLLNQTSDDTLRQMALNINHGAKKLNSSINDLLDIMRGEIGILQLERTKTDIVKLVAETVQFYSYEARRKKQSLTFHVSRRVPLACLDHERLTQVVMNLLENALRHTPSGGSILVRLSRKEENVTIEVIDSGRGIPEVDLPFIFEPYALTGKRSKPSGLGLGLPLAKMLVELHGGDIWAKNQPNGGANVGFSIPIRIAPVANETTEVNTP